MKRASALLSAALLFSLTLPAVAQVVETPEGPVEFVGLEKWTVDDVKKVMAEKAPGEPLGRCGAVLQEAGFPSAIAGFYPQPDGKIYTVTKVVEPHRADRIKMKKEADFLASRPAIPAWKVATDLIQTKPNSFQMGLLSYIPGQGAPAEVKETNGADPEAMRALWSFLATRRSEADRDLALWTLANDGNPTNRIAASAVLINFGGSDLTWWTLLDAQRDPFGMVSGTAQQVLAKLAREKRTVDWEPALTTVRHLLNGTNVSNFDTTLRVLMATGLPKETAPVLLRDGGGDLLLAHLKAQHEPARRFSHRFLQHLSGQDFGTDVAAWKKWIDGLAQPAPAAPAAITATAAAPTAPGR